MTRKKQSFFLGGGGGECFWFNNLGLGLGMALKFYTCVVKGLKLKVRKFWDANSCVFRSYMGKTGRFHPE